VHAMRVDGAIFGRTALNYSSRKHGKIDAFKYARKRISSPNVIYKDRFIFGEFHQLYPQLRADKIMFHAYTRMTTETFDYIAQHITPICQREYTNFQDPISVGERLLITIR